MNSQNNLQSDLSRIYSFDTNNNNDNFHFNFTYVLLTIIFILVLIIIFRSLCLNNYDNKSFEGIQKYNEENKNKLNFSQSIRIRIIY